MYHKDYRILGCIESVSSETLVPMYKTARWHMTEDTIVRCYCRKNFKF